MTINALYLNTFTNTNNETELGNMAAKVALQNLDYRYATLLFFNSSLYYGVELFLRVFNYNIIVNSGIPNFNLIKKADQYVIFVSDVKDLEQLIDTSKQDIKGSGTFIIVCQSQFSQDCSERKITKLFWKNKIVNIVIIKPEKAQTVGYTYFPISDGHCNNVEPIKLASSNCSQYLTTDYGTPFKMKIKKLNFCPLFVSTFIQTPYMKIIDGVPIGADGDFLRIIAYGLNTTLKLNTPYRGDGWGYIDKDGTWVGSLGDVYDDLANMSMTSGALTLARFINFEVSRSYCTVHIVWVTHPANLRNEALKLLHPFKKDTQIALIVSYMFIILCAFVIKTDKWSSMCRYTKSYLPSRSIVFYSWMICMGQSIKLPTKSTSLQMIILWVYYSFIIRTVYQVYLISCLKGKFYEDQFENIEDAIKANYPFGGGAALQDYYINYPEVYDNWITIETDNIVPTVLDISKGKKFVIAMNWDTAKKVIRKYKISLHVLPQKIITSPAVIFLKKHTPLLESLNLVLDRLIVSGFPEKIHKKYTSIVAISESNNDQEILKMIHFSACYAILIIGWILSALFFLIEVYFGKVYKHPLLLP